MEENSPGFRDTKIAVRNWCLTGLAIFGSHIFDIKIDFAVFNTIFAKYL